MPYIKQRYRPLLDPPIDDLIESIEDEGELNYTITRLMLGCIRKHGGRYTDHNAAFGAMFCAALELYRRRTAPYEDEKIAENGDVE